MIEKGMYPPGEEGSPLLGRGLPPSYNASPMSTVSVGRLRNTSSFMTFVNVIKSYIAAGFLVMPFFYKNAGIIGGTLMIVILASLCAVTTLYLVQAKLRLEQYSHNVFTYTDVVREAVGPGLARYVTISIIICQCGFCVAYTFYMSDNVGIFFPDTDERIRSGIIMSCYGLLAFMIMTIRTQQYLGYIGMFSAVCFYTGVIGVVVVAFYDKTYGDPSMDGPLHIVKASNGTGPVPQGQTQLFGTAVTTILGFGQVVYSYEGIGTVLPAYAAIRNVNHFMPIIIAIVFIMTCLYSGFGVLNYVTYGAATRNEITDNIQQWAQDMDTYRGERQWLVVATVIRLLLLVGIGGTYGHQMFPVTDLLDEFVAESPRLGSVPEIYRFALLRMVIVFTITLASYLTPSFDFILTIVGAVGSTPLQFVIPCVVYVSVFKDEMLIWSRIFATLMGVVGTIAGSVCLVVAILAETGVVEKAPF